MLNLTNLLEIWHSVVPPLFRCGGQNFRDFWIKGWDVNFLDNGGKNCCALRNFDGVGRHFLEKYICDSIKNTNFQKIRL